MNDEHDEFNPREVGLLVGAKWAELARTQGLSAIDAEGRNVDPVVAASEETPRIPAHVRDQIMDTDLRKRLDASEDPDAEGAFWAGFRDGVRAYLVQIREGTGPN